MTAPTTTAAHVDGPGAAETVRVGPVPVSGTGPTDVLVAVAAVAANPVDTSVRAGRYPTPMPLPFVVGRDLVGTVAAAQETTGSVPGGQMWCNSLGHDGRQGSFAQFAAVPAERLYRLPEGADPYTAVAIAHPAATAYSGWFVHTRLRPGGVDVVWETPGHHDFDLVAQAGAVGARVLVSAAASPASSVPWPQLYARDVRVLGFVISRATVADLAASVINGMLRRGLLTARIAELLPLSRTAQIHQRLEAGEISGRVVLRP